MALASNSEELCGFLSLKHRMLIQDSVLLPTIRKLFAPEDEELYSIGFQPFKARSEFILEVEYQRWIDTWNRLFLEGYP
jgi:hypothetical protein